MWGKIDSKKFGMVTWQLWKQKLSTEGNQQEKNWSNQWWAKQNSQFNTYDYHGLLIILLLTCRNT